MGEFADALHAAGKKLTVDVGTWNPSEYHMLTFGISLYDILLIHQLVWNYSAISQSSIDRVFTMATYTGRHCLDSLSPAGSNHIGF